MTAPIGIIYEHPTWLDPLFDALDRRGVEFAPIDVSGSAYDIDDAQVLPLYVNRLSASSYDRGNQAAVAYTLSYIDHLRARGARVLNGASAHLEINKAAQLLAFKSHGLSTPRTVLFNSRAALAEAADSLAFPALTKPAQGGAGAMIRRYESAAQLVAESAGLEMAPDGLMLLQEFVQAADGVTHRVEILDGKVLYTLRVNPGDEFNSCPADAADNEFAGPTFEVGGPVRPELEAAILAMFGSFDLSFGSVEYRVDRNGEPQFFDLNLNTNYHPSIPQEWPEGGWGKLADYLGRQATAG